MNKPLAVTLMLTLCSSVCARPEPPAQAPAERKDSGKSSIMDKGKDKANDKDRSMQPVSLDFQMKVEGGKLHIDYTLTNQTAAPVLVQDVMVATHGGQVVLSPAEVAVTNGSQPGQVLFVRGRVEPDGKIGKHYHSGLRELAAHGKLTGSADVPLPLQASHPYGSVPPLEGTPKEAVLEIQYFDGGIITGKQRLSDGSEVTTPQSPDRHAIKAGPKPIPGK